jgi:FeS assembly SUF system protein
MDEPSRQRLNLPLHGEKNSSVPDSLFPALPPDAPLKEKVLAVLRTCYDPEIPINIYELGLIYDLMVDDAGAVTVRMTLTTPACPVAGSLPGDVQRKVEAIPGVTSAKVDLVWDPPWDKNRMSEEAQLELGLFD